MKILLVILGIVVVAAIAVVAGCRMLASRSTEATVALTAKLPGKIAVVYYSQSKVGNTAMVAKWIAKHTGGELVPIETVEAYPDAYGDTLKAAKRSARTAAEARAATSWTCARRVLPRRSRKALRFVARTRLSVAWARA